MPGLGSRQRGTIPSLALIFIVLGTIFMGLAKPVEAGAKGVVGAWSQSENAPGNDLGNPPSFDLGQPPSFK